MDYQVKREDGRTVLFASGDLKTSEAAAFEQRLLDELDHSEKLTLDLGGVGYICSAGLRALLAGQQKADELDEGALVVRNACDEVLGVFKSTGFINVLTVE